MKKLISIAIVSLVISIFAVAPANAWVNGAGNTNKIISSIRINGQGSDAVVQIWCAGETQYIGFPLTNGSASAMLAAVLSAKATGSTINVNIPDVSKTVNNISGGVIIFDFIDINQ